MAWTATLRADQACRMGEALFAKCVRAGLRRVMVGVESGSQAMLDRLKKDLRLEQVLTAAEMCARHDVGVIFNFIVGFPGETDDSVDATLALAKRLRAHAPALRDADLLLPAVSRKSDRGAARERRLRVPARARGLGRLRLRRRPRPVGQRRHAGGRSSASSSTRGTRGSRARWRWPLRAASRWRCDRDWYGFPVEKTLVELVRPPQQVS